MVSVSEVVKTWQEGFANKDSSKLGEFFTDDFRFVSKASGGGSDLLHYHGLRQQSV